MRVSDTFYGQMRENFNVSVPHELFQVFSLLYCSQQSFKDMEKLLVVGELPKVLNGAS